MSVCTIPEASGASICPQMLEKTKKLWITDFGASIKATPTDNTAAVNKAIDYAAHNGGGTVVIPSGIFKVYTIFLQSNVNLFLEEGAIIMAAKTEIVHSYEKQEGEGGNYCEPEINLYVGLQDHGHTYFANSLLFGMDLENIMIYGKGLITGGRFHQTTGLLEYVLQGGDPLEPNHRDANGHQGEWFGNKGLSLVRCRNIVLKDFTVTFGGHFAILAEGCDNLYADHLLIDTIRDGFDIDCCQNVTVRNTICNSLTDDSLCLKASFGSGLFKPLENVLIEDCTVSGYDAGSVYAGVYTCDKLTALDRCGPTGRVKFGTESTCGYHLVTIRRVTFDRSRGFCMEAVDCSSLTDILFEDCTLDNVSSSPLFIRAGDRGRFPVTGNSSCARYPADKENVRIDHPDWILPNTSSYHCYPAKRYTPHYNRTKTVTVDGHSFFKIVDATNPIQHNPINYEEKDHQYYLKTWQQTKDGGTYTAKYSKELSVLDLPLYANAVGCQQLATIENVCIRNVRITNADPRYPILLMGMTDSHLKNIVLENISVEYRGGLSMEHAVEQRQLNTNWKFSQFHTKEQIQNIPWLVNTFFLKNEGLLPRVDWDAKQQCWMDDPYNIPELPEVYPEASNWGILPAYGLFVKHVDGLTLRNLQITCKVPDGRHVCVLDDVHNITIDQMDAYCAKEIAPIAVVTHKYRRHTNAENVPEQPYFTTTVSNLILSRPIVLHHTIPAAEKITYDDNTLTIAQIMVNAPAPGTPPDSLYSNPTTPCQETGYTFAVDTDFYPLPLTVHRPFIQSLAPITVFVGEPIVLHLTVRCPASDVSELPADGIVYNEQTTCLNYSVKGISQSLTLYCKNLPVGSSFDANSALFSWTPDQTQTGTYNLHFFVDDGILAEQTCVSITVCPII